MPEMQQTVSKLYEKIQSQKDLGIGWNSVDYIANIPIRQDPQIFLGFVSRNRQIHSPSRDVRLQNNMSLKFKINGVKHTSLLFLRPLKARQIPYDLHSPLQCVDGTGTSKKSGTGDGFPSDFHIFVFSPSRYSHRVTYNNMEDLWAFIISNWCFKCFLTTELCFSVYFTSNSR
jgi:hypothetical protein